MIEYTYEKISIDLTGNITVTAFTTNTSQPGKHVILEQSFAPGTGVAAVDAAIAQSANIVWSLQN